MSFKDIGLLEELEKSTKYVPPYVLELNELKKNLLKLPSVKNYRNCQTIKKKELIMKPFQELQD